MEQERVKKYIYVSPKIKANLENIFAEQEILQSVRFIGTYDIEVFFRNALKNLNGIDFLVLDLASFESSKTNKIINVIKVIREKYECRVIVIAEGYKQGDITLGRLFNLGIYNIVTASTDIEEMEQLRKTITEEGMTFGNAMRFRIEDNLNTEGGTNLVKETYIKVKQTFTIGICSTEKHCGATTLAINLSKYLNEFDNVSACYIENNTHDTILSLKDLHNSIYYEQQKKVSYDNLDLYLKPDSIAEIQKQNYSFYVYDFGNFDEMSSETKNTFISRDLKIIVSGSRVWEEDKIANCLFEIGEDMSSYLFVNFLKLEDRKNFLKVVGSDWEERTYFSDLILDPFEVKNRSIYEKILEPYLFDQKIKEKEKKGIIAIFRKKRKDK